MSTSTTIKLERKILAEFISRSVTDLDKQRERLLENFTIKDVSGKDADGIRALFKRMDDVKNNLVENLNSLPN